MCRLTAYLGQPVTLEDLLVLPPHALIKQAHMPKHQTHGIDNLDGWGVGWYGLDRRREPARYRTATPVTEDRSFASFAGLVSSGAILAALRSATPGFPIEETGSQPFTSGPWLFAHYGTIERFQEKIGNVLRAHISPGHLAVIEGVTDSETLFALALDRLDAGDTMSEALAWVVATVNEVTSGRMNLAITDGYSLAATAWGNSLYVLDGGDRLIAASEPYDGDERWQRVPDASLVFGAPGDVVVKPL